MTTKRKKTKQRLTYKDGMERPILFNGPMVQAILEGRKTQTRRIVKPQPELLYGIKPILHLRNAPYQVGQRLWVREGWRWFGRIVRPGELEGGFEYRADLSQRKFETFADPDARWEDFKAAAIEERYHWRPSIHMPRWASRITLEVTEVRVQRLQDISEEDAKAEGVAPSFEDSHGIIGSQCFYRYGFSRLWDSINKKSPWDSNPFVWAVTFRRIECQS
jgi:hypothetical protein